MKAPDKIYVSSNFSENDSPHGLWYLYKSKHDINVEYIRKDALLEIIKTARESAIVQRNYNNCQTEQEARIDAYDYIEHKIESL